MTGIAGLIDLLKIGFELAGEYPADARVLVREELVDRADWHAGPAGQRDHLQRGQAAAGDEFPGRAQDCGHAFPAPVLPWLAPGGVQISRNGTISPTSA